MTTPGGYRMSVAMTNCGTAGWLSDRRGYRYGAADPETGRLWPALPAAFAALAGRAAAEAGFPGFVPDACLINQIGRAHVCTPVTNAQRVCGVLLDANQLAQASIQTPIPPKKCESRILTTHIHKT